MTKIAEAKIRSAIKNGELKNLPGEGKPLNIEDNPFVPEELRAFYRLMKNSGIFPEEVALKKEIELLRKLINDNENPEEKSLLRNKLNELTIRYNIMMEKS